MEPQILDYYNEFPSGVNIINKLNEEFDESQKEKVEEQKEKVELKKELEKYKPIEPLRIKVNTIDDFIKKGKSIKEFIPKFKKIIYDFLKHEGWASELPEPHPAGNGIISYAGLGHWDTYECRYLIEYDKLYGFNCCGIWHYNLYLKMKLIEELYNLFEIDIEKRNKRGWFNQLLDEAFTEVEQTIITMLENCYLSTNKYYDIIYKIIGTKLFGWAYQRNDIYDDEDNNNNETFIQNIYYYECKKCKEIVDGNNYDIINTEEFRECYCDCLC